jgi:hypothetical protein
VTHIARSFLLKRDGIGCYRWLDCGDRTGEPLCNVLIQLLQRYPVGCSVGDRYDGGDEPGKTTDVFDMERGTAAWE